MAAEDVRSWAGRVRVARVDPAREEPGGPGVRAWHAVVAASTAHDLPGNAPVGPDRFHAHLTGRNTAVWTASRAGQVVGLAVLRPPYASATGRAELHVHPDHRRRGIGNRLATALTAEARTRGLGGVIAAVSAGGIGDTFCLRHGLTRVRTLHHLLLSLRELPPGWLDELAAAEHPGYRLTGTARIFPPGCRDAVPADVLLTVAAEHDRKVVGCTEVVVPRGHWPRATRHDRPLADGHHGLGPDLGVKATMLRLLYDHYPQSSRVTADNPGHGSTLPAVDRHLGFRLHHRINEYRLDITEHRLRTGRTTRRTVMGSRPPQFLAGLAQSSRT